MGVQKSLENRTSVFLLDLGKKKSLENVIIVQEVVHHFQSQKDKPGSMLLKLDLNKAYDRLEWGFIRKTLVFFNFPHLWVDIIMSCISTSSLTVLINGCTEESFVPTGGIRQGDPLSPYIFILCLEYLSIAIANACEDKSWTPIRISKGGPALPSFIFRG